MDKKELYLMHNIILGWMYEIDCLAEGRISTKYRRLQDEIRNMLEFIMEKIEGEDNDGRRNG